jgi:hypothetical protein
MSAAAGVAALEQIVGEEGDMRTKGVGAEIARPSVRRLRKGRGGQEQRGQPRKQDIEFHGKMIPGVQPIRGGLIHEGGRGNGSVKMNASQRLRSGKVQPVDARERLVARLRCASRE